MTDRDHAIAPRHAGDELKTETYAMGNISLDLDRRSLTGPRGEVRLCAQVYAIAARLMRRPGVIVSASDLISAMYEHPDDEPDTAEVVLRRRLQNLRYTLFVISQERIKITSERGIGYSLEMVR